MSMDALKEMVAIVSRHEQQNPKLQDRKGFALASLSVSLMLLEKVMGPREISVILYGHADDFAVKPRRKKNAE